MEGLRQKNFIHYHLKQATSYPNRVTIYNQNLVPPQQTGKTFVGSSTDAVRPTDVVYSSIGVASSGVATPATSSATTSSSTTSSSTYNDSSTPSSGGGGGGGSGGGGY